MPAIISNVQKVYFKHKAFHEGRDGRVMLENPQNAQPLDFVPLTVYHCLPVLSIVFPFFLLFLNLLLMQAFRLVNISNFCNTSVCLPEAHNLRGN